MFSFNLNSSKNVRREQRIKIMSYAREKQFSNHK